MSRAVVMVIEDDPDAAAFLEAALSAEYETKVARDGIAAKRLLEGTAPDLVVLDLRLPDIPGADICRMIRQSARLHRTPILVVTGFPDSAEVDAIRDLGVDRILAKPVTARRLLEAVKRILSEAPR